MTLHRDLPRQVPSERAVSIRSVCSGHAAGVLLFPGTSKSLSSLHAASHNSKAARRVSTLQSPIAATAMASVSPLTRPPLLPPLLSPRLSLLLHGDRADNFSAPEVIIISNIVISEAARVYVKAIAVLYPSSERWQVLSQEAVVVPAKAQDQATVPVPPSVEVIVQASKTLGPMVQVTVDIPVLATWRTT